MPYFQIACAITIAMAQPLLFVVVRHGIRIARLRALYEFDQLFEVSKPVDETGPPDGPRQATPERTRPAPTYEYVRARYTDDIEFPDDFDQEWIRTFDMGVAKFRHFVRKLRWWHLKSSWNLLGANLPLGALIAFGLTVLFTSTGPHGGDFDFQHFASPLLVTAGLADGAAANLLARNVTVVAEAAFVGAYVFTLLLFLRALATFDLSPLTIVRGTTYFVVGILAAVMLYIGFQDLPSEALEATRAVGAAVSGATATTGAPASPPAKAPPATKTSDSAGPELIRLAFDRSPGAVAPAAPASRTAPTLGRGGAPGAATARTSASATPQVDRSGSPAPAAPEAPKPLAWAWVVFGFLLGFTPDLALNAMASLVQRTFRIKTTDEKLAGANKSTPLEILDGIDVLTRFRLQEANIFEVQNLAVANPVMLFIETPYGIYEVIDWVAQAQLCMSVGPDRFLELQRRSIRTIFDLERSVLSVYTTSQFRRYVASILLAPPPDTGRAEAGVSSYSGVAATPGPGGVPQTAAGFAEYVADLFSQKATASDGAQAAPDPDETIKHLVRTMVDDLHVCRLRQIWQQIMAKIDGVPPGSHSSDRLWDTEWEPPLPKEIPRPPYYGKK